MIMMESSDSQSQIEYEGELEQRIVDLESANIQLRLMMERIGREKRTVPAMRWWYLMLWVIIINTIFNGLRFLLYH